MLSYLLYCVYYHTSSITPTISVKNECIHSVIHLLTILSLMTHTFQHPFYNDLPHNTLSPTSPLSQAVIFVLVESYMVIGDALYPFVSTLPLPQKKLLTIYISKQSTPAVGTPGSTTPGNSHHHATGSTPSYHKPTPTPSSHTTGSTPSYHKPTPSSHMTISTGGIHTPSSSSASGTTMNYMKSPSLKFGGQ